MAFFHLTLKAHMICFILHDGKRESGQDFIDDWRRCMTTHVMPIAGMNTREGSRKTGIINEFIESMKKITMKDLPRVILHKKMIRLKFKIPIIVHAKLVYGHSLLV